MDKSSLDQRMRYQGSYSCKPFSRDQKPNDSLAEAQVTRIRCAKDRWAIYGKEIHYTRMLYGDRECLEPLGTIEFRSMLHDEEDGYSFVSPKCTFSRKSTRWITEESGRCMLNHLELNQPTSIRSLAKCRRYLPSFCQNEIKQKITGKTTSASPDDRKPHELVSFAEEECVRYDTT